MHSFEVFADYYQFYLWDAGTDPQPPETISEEDVRRMVVSTGSVVVIQPVRNMDVPVELEMFELPPAADLAAWDHIAECSLHLPTGHLQVHECTGESKLDLQVKPGSYAVRALFANLNDLSDDGLDGNDRYRIEMWPAPPQPLRVVKQRPDR